MSNKRDWVMLHDYVDGRVHLAPYLGWSSLWPLDHPCLGHRGARVTSASPTPTCLWCVAYWLRDA